MLFPLEELVARNTQNFDGHPPRIRRPVRLNCRITAGETDPGLVRLRLRKQPLSVWPVQGVHSKRCEHTPLALGMSVPPVLAAGTVRIHNTHAVSDDI